MIKTKIEFTLADGREFESTYNFVTTTSAVIAQLVWERQYTDADIKVGSLKINGEKPEGLDAMFWRSNIRNINVNQAHQEMIARKVEGK